MGKKNKIKDENELLLDQFYSLRLVQTSASLKRLTLWLEMIVGLFVLFLFLPWTQNIRGSGKVIALNPAERPQEVPAVIGGAIAAWFVQEGQYVEAGDTLIQLREVKDKYLDPNLLSRLEQQLQAKEDAIVAYTSKIIALENQIVALRQSMNLKRQQVDNKLRQSFMKVKIDSAGVQAAIIEESIAKDQYNRMKALYQKQLEPLVKLEERQNKLQSTTAKRIEAENKLMVSQADVQNAYLEQSAILAEYSDKIAKAESDKNTAQASLYDAQALVAKLKNELSGNRIRAGYYFITAPQSGYVVKAMKAGVGEQIKEGEGICTIMPDNAELAAEVYVRAMDVPLLSIGRLVRVQFDGWPAIQVSGWPSVAIGTFSGKIHVIDYVNSPGGYYRVLVKMDTLQDDEWPPQLRVGSGVYAWALLEEVPVIYEIWRQLNGFPPSLSNVPTETKVNKDAYPVMKEDAEEKES